MKKSGVKKNTQLSSKASLWTGVVVITLAASQARGETLQTELLAKALDENGKFRLADLNVQTLQALQNALNPSCIPGGYVSCTWTVLSLTHQPLEPDTPAFPNVSVPGIPVTPSIPAAPTTTRPNQRFSNDVPPGFEQFAAQLSEDISLYFDGVNILTARIVITEDSYRFSDPLLVANELAKLKFAKRTTLEYFFSEDFPLSNAGICVLNNTPLNCQSQQPLELALITNLDENRADILVNHEPSNTDVGLLVDSSSGLSARAGVRATYAAIGGKTNTLDGRMDGSISYGNGGLFAQKKFTNNDTSSRIDRIFFAHHFKQQELTIGTVDFSSQEFLLRTELIGASFSTSFNRILDLRDLYSTALFVDLVSTSVVQLLVNDELLSSQSLDSGNHRLDTRNLPTGTYEVEIRIQNASNGIQVQRQIFSKQLALPPPDQLVYEVTAGKPRQQDGNTFDTDNDTLISGSVSKRISPNVGVDVQVASFLNEQTAQARLTRIGTNYELSVGGLVGSQSAFGSSIRAAYRINNVQLSVQGTRFLSDHDVQNNPSIANIVSADFFTRSAGVTYSAGDYRFGIYADKTTQDDGLDTITKDRFSARVRRKISLGSAGSAVSAAYLATEATTEVQFQVNVAFDGPKTNQQVTLDFTKANNQSIRPTLGYQLNYKPSLSLIPLSNGEANVSLTARASEDSSIIGGDINLTDQFYDLGIGIDLYDDELSGELEHRTIASIGTQVAAADGHVAIGRNTGQTAGIIIDVDGQPAGSKFDVKVDGSQRGVGRVGSKFFLPLTSFQKHRIDLIPHSIVLGNFESASRTVTLYPGNIASMQIDVQGRYLLITRFADSQGQIISDKVIRYQGRPYFINDAGVVQLEVLSGDTLDIDLGDDITCSITTPDPLDKEIVIEPVPLVCL